MKPAEKYSIHRLPCDEASWYTWGPKRSNSVFLFPSKKRVPAFGKKKTSECALGSPDIGSKLAKAPNASHVESSISSSGRPPTCK
jgi:hypothetical protein